MVLKDISFLFFFTKLWTSGSGCQSIYFHVLQCLCHRTGDRTVHIVNAMAIAMYDRHVGTLSAVGSDIYTRTALDVT